MPLREAARQFRKEFREHLVSFVTAASAFTAALFWNTAITDMLKAFVQGGGTWPNSRRLSSSRSSR